jgi:hypothetical protein
LISCLAPAGANQLSPALQRWVAEGRPAGERLSHHVRWIVFHTVSLQELYKFLFKASLGMMRRLILNVVDHLAGI